MPDTFDVSGGIASRWLSYGGANGPFGRPTRPEHTIPDRNGRRQTFEMGEIAECPDQDMVVSVFRLRNEACFDWVPTGFDYDYFRYDIAFNGVGQGQAAMQLRGTTRVWTRLQGFGEYAFIVKGCHSPLIGADECKQGFTIPVRLQFGRSDETPDPGGPAVNGLIGERWHELGAWAGPLGRPITDEIDFAVAGFRGQNFEHGWIATAPAFGPRMVVAVYQRGNTLEVNWGGADRPFNAFRVDVRHQGALLRQELVWQVLNTEWARPGIGSGQLTLADPADGFYEFHVNPTIAVSPLPTPAESFTFGETPDLGIFFRRLPTEVVIDQPAINGTPAQAFASHAARATDVARHFALLHPLRVAFHVPKVEKGEATEDDALQLIAHLHAASEEHEFRVPGELPSRALAIVRLTQLTRGHTGTGFDAGVVSRRGDYDMALKSLLLIAYRYRALLTQENLDFITRSLVPEGLVGGHDPGVEFFEVSFLQFDVPETENHVLMIESCRYLVNQILFDRTGDPKFDNVANGLTDWLLGHLQRLAKHDFLEFNSRPYGRLSLHVLFNLHELAREEALRTAAQIVLDYISVKFAVSSSRNRRVPPFRRLRERTNSPTVVNEIMWDPAGDPLTGFFMMYTGLLDRDGRPVPAFPNSWTFNALIAGLAAYRPPPAAYSLAMLRHGPAQHRFYHGVRPQLVASDDIADGGVEIYFRSPSFLLSAGGMFLNSGYGSDASPFNNFKQVAIAGSTTLLPTRADVAFADLIRFDTFQDPRDAVNTGVHRGFACGANLRIPDKWFTLTGASREGSWTFLDLNRDTDGLRLGLYVAAYRTPPREAEDGLDNLGLLYAIESSVMDFEKFSRVTRERNATLPARLKFGEVMVFNTPEDDRHSFTFRLLKEGSKYATRIFEMDDRPLGQDFRTLPLVEGPWLRAPNGHDGLIEIRDPDCDTPLVLDYRDPRRPVRIENAAACPQPWVDRRQALRDFAGQLLTRSHQAAAAAKPAEGVDFARKAVATLRPLVPAAEEAATHWPFFAATVWILAMRLMEARRMDDALGPASESVELCRRAAAVPGVDLHALCGQLLTLSHQLASGGRPGAAIEPAAAAVEILRGPASAPGATAALTTLFAISVETLTRRLFDAGRDAEALAPAAEAVTAFRRAADTPGADVRALAGEAFNLSALLASKSRPTEAVDLEQAAVDILRPAASVPSAPPDLRSLFAAVLEGLARRLLEANRRGEALKPADESLAICEQLARDDPAKFQAQLAGIQQLISQLRPA